MRSLKITMTEPQAKFFQLQDKYPAFVGGFGTGKTETLANCAIRDALEAPNGVIALYEPTYDLVRLILAPRMDEKLNQMGIRFKYNKNENIIYTSSAGCADFILRTLDNPERIVGYESYRAHVDEIDTLKQEQAQLAWRKIIARNRQKPKGTADPFNRVSVYTTPEGFRFVYQTWKKDPKPGYVMIQAQTASNPFLPDDYISTLESSYPANLIKAYLNGEFVNLVSGAVYPDFDRKLNHTSAAIERGEALHVGMDFNRLKMSATVSVIRDGKPLTLNEITDARDTPQMAQLLDERYKQKGHQITIYPDASGQNSSSKNASESDFSILRAKGFHLYVDGVNPAIMDRINSVNAMILNDKGERRWLVNTDQCPSLTEALEQQVYDKNGMPDKSAGHDHACFTGDTMVETRSGWCRFDELPASGHVRGPDGEWVDYCGAGRTGDKLTVKITFANGYVIKCSQDHLFLVRSGKWIQAKDLMGQECLSLVQPVRSLMGDDFTFVEDTSKTQMQRGKNVFIGLFGSRILAQFLMDIMSTISTATEAITSLKTYFAFQAMSTFGGMVTSGLTKLLNWAGSINLSRKLGMPLRRVSNGIKSSMKEHLLRFELPTKQTAHVAESNLRQAAKSKTEMLNTAQRRVRHMPGGRVALTTLVASAQSAAPHSEQIVTVQGNFVTSVSLQDVRAVYCLTVPNVGCFKLSLHSPIVSNCDAQGYFIVKRFPVVTSSAQRITLYGH